MSDVPAGTDYTDQVKERLKKWISDMIRDKRKQHPMTFIDVVSEDIVELMLKEKETIDTIEDNEAIHVTIKWPVVRKQIDVLVDHFAPELEQYYDVVKTKDNQNEVRGKILLLGLSYLLGIKDDREQSGQNTTSEEKSGESKNESETVSKPAG